MSRILIVSFIISIVVFSASYATADSPPGEAVVPNASVSAERSLWTATVDPLTTALGFVHVQVERALGDDFSIYAGPSLRLFSSPLTGDDEPDDLVGYGGEIGLRYFLLGPAPEGLWLMLRGVAAYVTVADESGFGGYLSHLLGYTWIYDNWLVLAGGAGIQYLTYRLDGHGPRRGMAPALHTNLGIAF